MTVLRVLGGMMLVALAALPASPAAAQDVVIGVAAPMTGNLAQIGKQFAEGAQLAADEVNAKGGIKGKKVVIRVEDDKGDPKEAATVAQKFASDDAVLAVLGHYSSSACFAAIPIYTKARLATITPSASHTELTKQGGKYMFRMWSPISVYVPDLAQYTVKKLGKKNVGVVYVQNDWGIQTKDYFVKELEKLGARVAALEVVYDKDTDFKAQLTKIKAANPDALAILTYYTTGAAGRHRHAVRGQVHRARGQGQRRGARREHRVQRRRSGASRQELRRHVPEAAPEREARALPRDDV
jgi:branched-chain amino acid transport system substrate-binding protein